MLRITKARKRKYVALGVSVEEKYWDFEKNRPKRNCPDKELIEKLIIAKETEYKETALELMANRREFTASSLAGKVERKVNAKTVKEMYEKLLFLYFPVTAFIWTDSFYQPHVPEIF